MNNTLEQATLIYGGNFLVTNPIPREYVGEVVLAATQKGWNGDVYSLDTEDYSVNEWFTFFDGVYSCCDSHPEDEYHYDLIADMVCDGVNHAIFGTHDDSNSTKPSFDSLVLLFTAG